MRPDLAKCTTERPRSGGGLASCYKLKLGGKVPVHPDPEHDYLDEYGGYRSSARHRHYESKNFTDCLGALRGNIRKNVGRRWDDVFSEFSRLLDRRSVSGYHIWTHLQWEVETDTICLNGQVYSSTKRWGYLGEPLTGFYVHPLTGILEYKAPPCWKRHFGNSKKELTIPVPDAPEWHYRKIDGLWFRLREQFIPENYWYDRATGKRGRTEANWIISERRSANKKEIAWIKQRILSKS